MSSGAVPETQAANDDEQQVQDALVQAIADSLAASSSSSEEEAQDDDESQDDDEPHGMMNASASQRSLDELEEGADVPRDQAESAVRCAARETRFSRPLASPRRSRSLFRCGKPAGHRAARASSRGLRA